LIRNFAGTLEQFVAGRNGRHSTLAGGSVLGTAFAMIPAIEFVKLAERRADLAGIVRHPGRNYRRSTEMSAKFAGIREESDDV